MGYAEAIEKQAQSLHRYSTPAGARDVHLMLQESSGALREGMSTSEAAMILRDGLCNTLLSASPFFVARNIAGLIQEASVQLGGIDRVTINASDLPTAAGYCLFETPLEMPRHVPTGEIRSLAALSWSLVEIVDGRSWITPHASNATHLQIFPWMHMPKLSPEFWLGSFVMMPLGSMERPLKEVSSPNVDRLWAVTSVLVTLCEFLRQRILQTSDRALMNRQARKRIAKILPHEPMVRVVQLRSRQYQQREESHDLNVEWSCQWLVRGHWRQQFFPASGAHRPIWIMPHVKGPADKPLRVTERVAYEVVR